MAIPVTIPRATITMEEADIIGWRKQAGDTVVMGEILFEMETDKVVVEVPAPISGTLLRIDVIEGTVKLDRPIGWIGQSGESVPGSATGGQAPAVSTSLQPAPGNQLGPGTAILASPAARRRARELGIEILSLAGTGPGGRITEADVENARGRS
jgi:pyruvate/2-oxoglutarate dehydrogenase complex dihydrolipoamide acyltransferase (E2) component